MAKENKLQMKCYLWLSGVTAEVEEEEEEEETTDNCNLTNVIKNFTIHL